jgi:hypothetical protein
MSFKNALTACLISTAALLSGCSAMRVEVPTVALIDPASTPREHWSDALVMLTDQMGIPSMADSTVNSDTGSAGSLIGKEQAFQYSDVGFVTGSNAIGVAGLLLGSTPPNPMLRRRQIAFWVPADEADNAEEASRIVAENWAVVRETILQGRRPVAVDDVAISAYPIQHPRWYGNPIEEIHNVRPPFVGEPRLQTVGDTEGVFYGPIFITPGLAEARDRAGSKLSHRDLMAEYAKYIPKTAMLYEPGNGSRTMYEQALLYWNGQAFPFQAKP